jgi:hypothetical protein
MGANKLIEGLKDAICTKPADQLHSHT